MLNYIQIQNSIASAKKNKYSYTDEIMTYFDFYEIQLIILTIIELMYYKIYIMFDKHNLLITALKRLLGVVQHIVEYNRIHILNY